MNLLVCSILIVLLTVLPFSVHGESEPEAQKHNIECKYKMNAKCDQCMGIQTASFRYAARGKRPSACPRTFHTRQDCDGCVYAKSNEYSMCMPNGYKYRYDVLSSGPGSCPAKRIVWSSKQACSVKGVVTDVASEIEISGNIATLKCKYEPYELIGVCDPKTNKQEAKFKLVKGSVKLCADEIKRTVACEGCTYSPSNMYDACCREGTKCKLDVLDNWCSSECPKYRCRPENLVTCVYVPSATHK